MKKKYENVQISIVLFTDVIVTSLTPPEDQEGEY